MGESDTIIAQTSAVPDFYSVGHNGASVAGGGSSAQASENMDFSATESNTGETVLSAANLEEVKDAGNAYSATVNLTQQETSTLMTYDTNEKLADPAHNAPDSSQRAGYNSSMNSNGVNEFVDFTKAVPENGLSAEEGRLWSIVTTNSLEFNSWTSLIEETERNSEGNVLKIRKVYDAFLAEFPLCYGYWKKYADHESRLSSIDKVAEVYERAVQGVTYSVDMWLHYCVFAIAMYGDPDTIRGVMP